MPNAFDEFVTEKENPFAEFKTNPFAEFVDKPKVHSFADEDPFDPGYKETSEMAAEDFASRVNAAKEAQSTPIIPPSLTRKAVDVSNPIGQLIKRLPFPESIKQGSEGVSESLAEGASGMTSGEMIATLPAFAIPVVGEGLALGLGAKQVGEGAGRLSVAQTPKEKGKAIGDIGQGAAMLIPGGAKAFRELPSVREMNALKAELEKSGVDPAKADQAARNLAAPGTVRPEEIQRIGPPPEVEPPQMFQAGDVPFDRMQRFGGQELPPVQILPKMGRIENVPILEEPRPIEQRETRGKVSFGVQAPVLLREAISKAEEIGLPKAAEAAAEVARGENMMPPYRAPKPATPENTRPNAVQRRAAVEQGLTMENPPMEPLPPEVGQFPPPVGMPSGTLSRLQSSRIQAANPNVRSNVRNNPPALEPIKAVEPVEAATESVPIGSKSVVGEPATTTSLPEAAEIAKRSVDQIESDLAKAREESAALQAIKPPDPSAPMTEKMNYLNTTAKAKAAAAVKVQGLEEGLKMAMEGTPKPENIPESPKPKTLSELGKTLPDAGESGGVQLPIDEIANRIRKVRDFLTIDPIPRLTRAMGGDIGTGNNSAIQHASARVAVPRMVDDLLAKVFPDQYTDPKAMQQTMEILNKDNILGGYDAFIQRAVDAQNAGHGSAAAHWRQMARDVANAHDLPGYEHDVRAAQANKPVADNIARWNSEVNPQLDQLYNEMKGMDANTPREGRGRIFGARVNLLPKAEEGRWIDALGDEQKPLPSPSSSNYRNPNAKKDKFDRRAKFTGEYSDNPAAVLANVLSHRYNEVTKIRFLNDLIRSGAGSWEKPASGLIHGQEAKPLPVKLPETKTEMVSGVAVDSATKQVERTIWVPEDTVSDVRGILDTDLRLQQNPVAKALTALQLAQLADAFTHTKNLHSVIANAQGTKALWSDVARKMPILSTADSAVRISKVLYDIAQDTPEIRAEMADMAKNGMLRQHFPATGLQKVTKMQDMIHHVDTAARVIMNRFYDNLVERGLAVDTMPARRKFVQQVGEYNKRLMGPMMQTMSRAGFSPFIVAGRNFNRFGRRLLTGHPGFETTGTKAQLQARLVNFATLGTIFVLPMMLNQVLTGSIWGRKGTPLGAVDFGTKEDEKGAHKVLDLASLYGVRRGMRATGVESIVEGLQNGRKPDEIVGGAINNVTSTAAHPWMGPALGAAYSTLTGQRLDLRGGPTPVEARKVGDRNSAKQIGENARVALKNQNPLLYSPFRPLFKDTEESFGKDLSKDFLRAPGSSVGVRDVRSPAMQKAAELMSGHQQTIEQQEKSTAKRQSVKALHEGDKETVKQFKQAGVLNQRDVQDVKEREKNPLKFMVKKLGAEDSVKVWELATPEERKEITKEINQKILNSTVLDLKEKRALRERIGTLKPIR